jgi:phospholipid/cholesterol/gamma-HCH transport system permease protein
MVFGSIIAIVSCRQGFATTNGAEGVGRATTNAVVYSFMSILVSDYFLTAILTTLKI